MTLTAQDLRRAGWLVIAAIILTALTGVVTGAYVTHLVKERHWAESRSEIKR